MQRAGMKDVCNYRVRVTQDLLHNSSTRWGDISPFPSHFQEGTLYWFDNPVELCNALGAIRERKNEKQFQGRTRGSACLWQASTPSPSASNCNWAPMSKEEAHTPHTQSGCRTDSARLRTLRGPLLLPEVLEGEVIQRPRRRRVPLAPARFPATVRGGGGGRVGQV